MELKHSKVKRGGVTSRYWYGSTDRIRNDVDTKGVHFRFTLSSKGGGDTVVLLTVGLGDLRNILKRVAAEHPKFASSLVESTRIAVSRLTKPQSANDG
jgi:hypothetical protein